MLSLDATTRNSCKDYEAFLKVLVARAERVGVLVMRSGLVGHDTTRPLKVSEFRGFVLLDSFAPVVFINDRDAKAAQIFTLAHELAHIWIGEGGVSDRRPDDRTNSKNRVEIFCDQVAAELLVPAEEFARQWRNHLSIDQNIKTLSILFRVSSLVVLRRAKDAKLINLDMFYAKVEEQYETYKRVDKEKLDLQRKREKRAALFGPRLTFGTV
jgi:Zn-dependent peptidase ImmA (M78 family)